jgi:hypothetical protein
LADAIGAEDVPEQPCGFITIASSRVFPLQKEVKAGADGVKAYVPEGMDFDTWGFQKVDVLDGLESPLKGLPVLQHNPYRAIVPGEPIAGTEVENIRRVKTRRETATSRHCAKPRTG